jgi:hypothetical protein
MPPFLVAEVIALKIKKPHCNGPVFGAETQLSIAFSDTFDDESGLKLDCSCIPNYWGFLFPMSRIVLFLNFHL